MCVFLWSTQEICVVRLSTMRHFDDPSFDFAHLLKLCDISTKRCDRASFFCVACRVSAGESGEVFNDVVVLNVIRLSREQRHGHGHGRSEQQSWGDPDDSLASEDKDASFNLDGDSCLDYDDCGGKNVCTRSSQGYRYRWVWPMVLGTPPAARLAHAAAVVRILGRGDSFIHGGRGREAYKGARNVSYMVVFGGVGEEDVFNDVGVLK